jgi:hypothetical protein
MVKEMHGSHLVYQGCKLRKKEDFGNHIALIRILGMIGLKQTNPIYVSVVYIPCKYREVH